MGNILDYLEWRGDLAFDADPFNEVDNLVLSELAYVSFDGLVPPAPAETAVPLKEVRKAYFDMHSRKAIRRDSNHIVRAPLLMDGMSAGKRFGSAGLTGYVNTVKADETAQMSAVTFLLGDGTAYVAFRGTDTTIVGWKEGFNMSYLPETEGQRRAVGYLNRIGKSIGRPLRVGGHSKGGNFAVYASAFCDREIRDRIIGIYTNDGPGFRDEVMETEAYRSILPKVVSIVPDTSIIGMLLTSDVKHRYIKSSAGGLVQHDTFSWEVTADHFVSSKPSELGLFIKKSQKDWLSKISDSDRELFVNTLFSLLESTGMETFDEMSERKLRAAAEIRSSMKEMPKDLQKTMNRILGELLLSGRDAALEAIAGSISEKHRKS